MTVSELRKLLDLYPDNLLVAIICKSQNQSHLDPDLNVDVAVEYAPGHHDARGATWAWRNSDPEDLNGNREVLVIY